LTVERSVTSAPGSPSARWIVPSGPTCTIWPRWRLSTIPFRRISTRTGGAAPLGQRARPERVRVAVLGIGADGSASDLPRLLRSRPQRRRESLSQPDPGAADLHVSRHPAVLHKLALLRQESTEPKKFRELVREISWLVGYEALSDARLDTIDVRTPLEETEGARLADRIGLIPILRAGLGMVEAFLELMPTAEVWHLGLFRDERTLRPVEYYNKLPDTATVDLCLILDPMLATGGSATAAIDVLKQWGARRIKLINLIAAPEGVRAVSEAHPDVPIHCAALDRQLDERGYILPGLGDAGDRQFGTGKAE